MTVESTIKKAPNAGTVGHRRLPPGPGPRPVPRRLAPERPLACVVLTEGLGDGPRS
jgi:hypothetical protein